MKNIMLKTIAVSALLLGGMTLANAEEATVSKAETNAQSKHVPRKSKVTGQLTATKALLLMVLVSRMKMVNCNLKRLHHNCKTALI
jgi:hypothetical protein